MFGNQSRRLIERADFHCLDQRIRRVVVLPQAVWPAAAPAHDWLSPCADLYFGPTSPADKSVTAISARCLAREERMIADMIAGRAPAFDASPYRITRF